MYTIKKVFAFIDGSKEGSLGGTYWQVSCEKFHLTTRTEGEKVEQVNNINDYGSGQNGFLMSMHLNSTYFVVRKILVRVWQIQEIIVVKEILHLKHWEEIELALKTDYLMNLILEKGPHAIGHKVKNIFHYWMCAQRSSSSFFCQTKWKFKIIFWRKKCAVNN